MSLVRFILLAFFIYVVYKFIRNLTVFFISSATRQPDRKREVYQQPQPPPKQPYDNVVDAKFDDVQKKGNPEEPPK
jgi:hypothetical protein